VKEEIFQILRCPHCKENINFDKEKESLRCPKCNRNYKIKNGIVNFSDESFDNKTSENFGFSWSKFPDIYKKEKKDFLHWIYPVKKSFFNNKVVLDAGCGNGLHAKMASEFGAKAVAGIDIASSVKFARENTKNNDDIVILKANIYSMPFKKESFDYVYSIGVIQHLPDREKAIKALVSKVKKGGSLSLWVYGYEGTSFVRLFIEPIRKILNKLFPPKIIYIISFPFAVAFYIISKLFRIFCKISAKLCKIFPLSDYFSYMGNFPFKYQFNTVFDQLVAPRSYFFKKEELKNIFKDFNFNEITITSRNKMSWRLFASGKN